MLAELVKQGKLPPVDQRLPIEPLVVTPVEQVGIYGGVWREAHVGINDRWQNSYFLFERIARFSPDFTKILPNVAKSWAFTPDGKSITINLRKGMNWSDGSPFTTADVMFWWEDVVLNDELTPTKPVRMKIGGELAKVEKVDDYAFKISFKQAYGAFEEFLPSQIMWVPATYSKQFHTKYADKAKLDAAMKEEGVDKWTALWAAKRMDLNNPGVPEIFAWVCKNKLDQPVQIYERNPYYWKVDTAGNQLPYLDRKERTLVPDAQAILLKALAGDIDYQDRNVAGVANRPVIMENRQKGDYRVLATLSPGTYWGTVFFNFTHKDPVLKELFNKVEFRQAFSLAVNRQEVNELIDKGTGTPGQLTCKPNSPWWKQEFVDAYAKYDPAAANKLLDALGLTKKDAEGYRLRSDGKRLSLVYSVFTAGGDQIPLNRAELVKKYLKDVGVEIIVKSVDRALWVPHVHASEHDIADYAANLGFFGNPPIVRGEAFLNAEGNQHIATQWGLWNESGGKQGVEPPAEIKKLWELYEKTMAEVSGEKRIQYQTEAMALHAKNLWAIAWYAEPDLGRFVLVKNNFRNVPDKAFDVETYHTAQFFIKK